VLAAAAALPAGCSRGRNRPGGEIASVAPSPAPPKPVGPVHAPIPARAAAPALEPGQTFIYQGETPRPLKIDEARAQGLLDVDLDDGWAPFIFQDGDGDQAKPNAYRATFIDLANDRINADGQKPRRGEHNYLDVFGIPPTLSVLAARVEDELEPRRRACYDGLDLEPLRRFTGEVGYIDRDRSKREYAEAIRDADWVRKEAAAAAAEAAAGAPGAGGVGGLTPAALTTGPASTATAAPSSPSAPTPAALEALRTDPKRRGRVDRYLRGQARVQAVRAAQALLVCDGLLSASARTRFVDGMYDLPTHEALAEWEKRNDIFGWGLLGGETLAALLRPPLELHFDTFKRILAERIADAAGIVEDGSASHRRTQPVYRDADGTEHPVPDLIGDHVSALLTAIHVATPEQMVAFLRSLRAAPDVAIPPALHVAFQAPPLPPYYGPDMELAVEIDRGDVWYDFPYDRRGKSVVQRRDHFPHLTLFVLWQGQKIPLCWWRTTIGSWRSEVHADGQIYMKYKNSDVGRRVWKNIVAGPVWIPPDGTPVRDLLTRKVLDRNVGPVTVVNTDVMGPGFQSAYGLVMAIHIDPKRGGFDNQIRTHGSVDYTSIARRFSHGCHRLVNNRAVRMFDFVLRHRAFQRVGNIPMKMKKRFTVDEKDYSYDIRTRGYYYELERPLTVDVSEGRIMGDVKKPITAFVHKPGVDYATVPSTGDAATSIAPHPGGPVEGAAPAPDLGP
jgi:hypothetical protein